MGLLKAKMYPEGHKIEEYPITFLIFDLKIFGLKLLTFGRTRIIGVGGTRTGLLGGGIVQNAFAILIKLSSLDDSIVAQS